MSWPRWQPKRPTSGLWDLPLETEDQRFRALVKLERKRCDLMVSNGPKAMHAEDNDVEVIGHEGDVIGRFAGRKEIVAGEILGIIQRRLIDPRSATSRAAADSPPCRSGLVNGGREAYGNMAAADRCGPSCGQRGSDRTAANRVDTTWSGPSTVAQANVDTVASGRIIRVPDSVSIMLQGTQ